MAYSIAKNGDIVIGGFEKGIAPSPHLGIANMQNVNIYTEGKEVMCSYARLQQNQIPISGGTLTGASTAYMTYSQTGTKLLAGSFVHITASTITNITPGDYYWVYYGSTDTTQIVLSSGYLLTNAATYGTTGTATFDTVDMVAPIQNQSATEQYYDSTGAIQYRYYVPDVNGRVWVYDTALSSNSNFFFNGHNSWALASNGTDASSTYKTASGLVVLNGNLLLFTGNSLYYKTTSRLDATWALATQQINSYLAPHFATVNHNNYCFYTDGNFVGQILPSSVSSAGNVNIWSYGVTVVSGGSTDTLNIHNSSGGYLIGGNFPVNGQTISFYSSSGGAPTGYSDNTVYYVVSASPSTGTFKISATVGGSALTGLSNTGTIYFNSTSFHTVGASGNATTIAFQALQLNTSDTGQCLVELGSNLLIGCQSNLIYNWNEVSIAGGGTVGVVQLPEANTVAFVQANNVAYALSGSKANVYVTNGSYVSLAMTIPDYTAGIAGTPTSYIEPYFSWGGAAFMRGRIWFSVQDQTASKTGNDGGIWSFVPTFFDPLTGAGAGLALRLENQNSYATYNGMANIILPFVSQAGLGPQFYTAWSSDQSSGSATYGIDTSSTNPYTGGQTLIETDLVPFGQLLGTQKGTAENIEVIFSAPLVTGESIAMNFRGDLTSTFSSAGTIQYDNGAANGARGAFIAPHQLQSLVQAQLQLKLTSTATNPTFVRIKEIRIRKRPPTS